MTQRYLEIETRWHDIRSRIEQAAVKSGRSLSDITPIAVTKTFPVTDVAVLQKLGFDQFGENRASELRQKASAKYDAPATWHMVGQMQTNKVNQAVRAADVFHSCDRPRLVQALQRAATGANKTVDVLIQVRLDEDPNRGGIVPDRVLSLAEEIVGSDALRLRGVMAMAPKDADPALAFARLSDVSQRLIAAHSSATWVSAGMTNDYEIAIEYGATHVRLGRGLLGTRPRVG